MLRSLIACSAGSGARRHCVLDKLVLMHWCCLGMWHADLCSTTLPSPAARSCAYPAHAHARHPHPHPTPSQRPPNPPTHALHAHTSLPQATWSAAPASATERGRARSGRPACIDAAQRGRHSAGVVPRPRRRKGVATRGSRRAAAGSGMQSPPRRAVGNRGWRIVMEPPLAAVPVPAQAAPSPSAGQPLTQQVRGMGLITLLPAWPAQAVLCMLWFLAMCALSRCLVMPCQLVTIQLFGPVHRWALSSVAAGSDCLTSPHCAEPALKALVVAPPGQTVKEVSL